MKQLYEEGDRVQILNGKVGTITLRSGAYYVIKFDNGFSGIWPHNYIKEKIMQTVLTVDDFKVGERVKYTGKGVYGCVSPERLNKSGTVTRIRGNQVYVQFDELDKDDDRGCYADNLEKENVKVMKITLSNGMTLEGTPEQVTQAAKNLGHPINDDLFYTSSTHGRMLIADMETTHIRNAMLKIHRTWSDSLSASTGMPLVNTLRNGCVDKVFVNLLTEYVKRVNR